MEPWGFSFANWQTGQLASTVANFSGRAKKPTTPEDFILDTYRLREERRGQKLKDQMMNALGHRVVKK